MRILFAGTPASAARVLDVLLASSHKVAAVLSQPDRPAGRGREVHRGAVAELATAHGLELLQPHSVREPYVGERLTLLNVDCVVVVAYGQLIPQHLLAIPRYGWLNLHYSLLPAWRGAAPVQHAILHGDEVTGASVFQIESGLDTGPVFGCVTESVSDTDTSETLMSRLTESGSRLTLAVLDAIEDGTAIARPQPSDGVSLAPRITADMTRIHWRSPAIAIQRAIRAFGAAPGAWTMWAGERIKLLGVPSIVVDVQLPAGTVHQQGAEVLVGTGTSAVCLDLVQPAGKSPMAASAWARGVRDLNHVQFV